MICVTSKCGWILQGAVNHTFLIYGTHGIYDNVYMIILLVTYVLFAGYSVMLRLADALSKV